MRYLFALIFLAFGSVAAFAQFPIKGSGILYFEGSPGSYQPDTLYGSELGYDITNEVLYFYDRQLGSWTPYVGGGSFPIPGTIAWDSITMRPSYLVSDTSATNEINELFINSSSGSFVIGATNQSGTVSINVDGSMLETFGANSYLIGVNSNASIFANWDKNSADDFSGSFGDLVGVPSGLADGDDNTFVNTISITGGVTKTVTLGRTDGTFIQGSFMDLSGAGGDGNDYLTGVAVQDTGTDRTLSFTVQNQQTQTVQFSVADGDNDPNNEIQDLSPYVLISSTVLWDQNASDDLTAVDTVLLVATKNDLANLDIFSGSWSALIGVPSGFADGVDNVDDGDTNPANELQLFSSAQSGQFFRMDLGGQSGFAEIGISDNSLLGTFGTSRYSLAVNPNGSIFSAWDKNAADDFSGDYDDLSNRPALFDGNYNSLSNLPVLFDGNYNSLSNLPTLFNGAFSSLTGVPTGLSDGDDNTTNSTLAVTGTTTKTITLTDSDGDSVSGTFQDLSGAGGDGNDFLTALSQTKSGNNVTITGTVSNQTNPSVVIDVSDGDSSGFNELQTLESSDETNGMEITLTSQSKKILFEPRFGLDYTFAGTANDRIFQLEADTSLLATQYDLTQVGGDQTLSITNDTTISISGGNSVSLSGFDFNRFDDFSGDANDLTNIPSNWENYFTRIGTDVVSPAAVRIGSGGFIANTPRLYFNSSSGLSITSGIGSTSDLAITSRHGNIVMSIPAGSRDLLLSKDAGVVAIGNVTGTLTHELEVLGSTQLKFFDNQGFNISHQNRGNTQYRLTTYGNNAEGLALIEISTGRTLQVWGSDGNSSIGLLSATEKLDVNGRIRARTIDTDNTSDNILVEGAGGVISKQAKSVMLLTDFDDTGFVASDADLLDGQQGTYYLDYDNFTNKPFNFVGADAMNNTARRLGMGNSPFGGYRFEVSPWSNSRTAAFDLGSDRFGFVVADAIPIVGGVPFGDYLSIGADTVRIGGGGRVVTFEGADEIIGLAGVGHQSDTLYIPLNFAGWNTTVDGNSDAEQAFVVPSSLAGGAFLGVYCKTTGIVTSNQLSFRVSRRQVGGTLNSGTANIPVNGSGATALQSNWTLSLGDIFYVDVTSTNHTATGLTCTMVVETP